MKTIESVFKEFLDEQRQCLDPDTYSDYAGVIDLFVQFLNRSAHLYLSQKDADHFKALRNEENKKYCEIFSPGYIEDPEVEGFLSYYMILNVYLGMDFLKTSVQVIYDLVKWMHRNGYMNDEIYEETEKDVQELKVDVPAAKELALLLFEYIKSQPLQRYTKRLSGYFEIEKIEPGRLWLYEYYTLGQTIGPVIVSEKISSKAKAGWTVYLAVGKSGNIWNPITGGPVYPRFSGEL
jgi:hypothetical protein